MKITKATDYAIRLLTYLVEHGGEGRSSEISKEIDVPFNHLAKLVQTLARKKYLITRRGKGGGLKLAKDPNQISLAELIEVIEGPVVISDCIFHREDCKFSSTCKARKYLMWARSQFLENLSAKSIFDLAQTSG